MDSHRLSDISFADHDTPITERTRTWSRTLQLQVAAFRLRYLFGQSCSIFCQSIRMRVPSGRQVYAILFMLGMEQVAFSSSTDFLVYPFLYKVGVGLQYINLVRSIVFYMASPLLFPVTGGVADIWVGHYRMIHFSLWLLWIGYALLAILYSITGYAAGQWNLYLLPLIFAMVCVGHAGFQASAIPFGANAIKYKTSQELSSYFYYYYWVRNLGLTIYFIATTCPNPGLNITEAEMYVMISVLCISLALCVYGFTRRDFVPDSERVNPYKKVLRVLYLALTIKRPVHRSAFSFTGAQPPSRLNLTKRVHGGKFTSEEVEDVKTFLRLLGVLLFILLGLILYSGVSAAVPLQLHDMNAESLRLNFTISHLGDCRFTDKFTLVSNILLLLLLIPILNSLLYPFLREYIPNMMKRFGVGTVMTFLSLLSLLVISIVGNKRDSHQQQQQQQQQQQCMFAADFSNSSIAYDYSSVSEFYIIIPLFLITVAEIFTNITSLEFLYAQSPHTMRGMMVGLFFFAWGTSSIVSQSLVFAFGSIGRLPSSATRLTCDFWYYLFYLCLALLAFVAYAFLVRKYRNRQRGEQESDLFYRPQS